MKISFFFLIPFLLFLGCASSNVQKYSAEEIKPVTLSEFILGPGDTIDVNVWRQDKLSKKIKIDAYGNFSYPFIGEINASGMSIHTLKEKLEEGLSQYYVDPIVTLSVFAVQSQKVFVLGEVSKPGVFYLDSPTNVLEAISKSGGFTIDAKDKNVLVIRGDKNSPTIIKLDLLAAVRSADIQQNISLQNGDIVYVPATYIANVSRYFKHLREIISTVVIAEQGVLLGYRLEEAADGKGAGDYIITITP